MTTVDNDRHEVFVTGCAGMIGYALCSRLLDFGHNVIGVDNLWRGRQDRVDRLEANANFEFRHSDIAFDQSWAAGMNGGSIVVHTADIVAGIAYVFGNEWQVFRRNIQINSSVAAVVNEREPKKLIYLGTACSYPQSLQRSVTDSVLSEKDKMPADPESGYGWSKLAGQIEFELALKDKQTKLITLDLHNVYGWPCEYLGSTSQVIPALINRAISASGESLEVWGDGTQGRAFLHVRDVVAGVLAAINYGGEIDSFMLGPAECTTIRDVASLIVAHPEVTATKLSFDLSKPTGDVGRSADARLAQEELGWTPRVSLTDGVNELIEEIIADVKSRSTQA